MSIVFVAAEILRRRQGYVGITARAPWVVALIFGLMHGLGFASGLKDAGLPDGHIPTALLFFSIGVEAGHFLFIGCVLALTASPPTCPGQRADRTTVQPTRLLHQGMDSYSQR